jgi:tetratricopeptide (TPR) repeat protein
MTEAYEKASSLEPRNPALRVDLGRAHLLVSDKIVNQINQIASSKNPDKSQIDALNDIRNQELEIAISELQKAIDSKADYSPAHFLLVQAYGRQGDLKKAIARSMDYYSLNPKDPGAVFQLGFLYYKDNQMDNAKLAFEAAIRLNEDYSNARYFLGLIYDSQGNKAAAKEQFEKIAVLNSDNQEVKKILENLNAGRPALETIVPPAPSPENRNQTPVKETGGAQEQEGIQP